jgi:hypothetical protein
MVSPLDVPPLVVDESDPLIVNTVGALPDKLVPIGVLANDTAPVVELNVMPKLEQSGAPALFADRAHDPGADVNPPLLSELDVLPINVRLNSSIP